LGELLDKFVSVRIVKANDLDLNLFQFDYDLTFSIFFMNADKTIYGRYGTRSSVEDAERHMSKEGLAQAMQSALMLHKNYPSNRGVLAGKQPIASKYKEPNDYPSLRGRYKSTLDYAGEVTKSCLHCHQIQDAARRIVREQHKPISEPLMYPYPLPQTIGFSLDPKTRSKIKSIADGSTADLAGLRTGDEVITLGGQAILSIADVQWVLHHTKSSQNLPVVVNRNGEQVSLTVKLAEGWRRQTDIAWRVSSWGMRRIGTGGAVFQPLTTQERRNGGVNLDGLALRVKHVGQYGAHGAAKRAGVKVGDILISYDSQVDDWAPSQLLGYIGQKTVTGQKVVIRINREGKILNLTLPIQK
jgi:serine protease Do